MPTSPSQSERRGPGRTVALAQHSGRTAPPAATTSQLHYKSNETPCPTTEHNTNTMFLTFSQRYENLTPMHPASQTERRGRKET